MATYVPRVLICGDLDAFRKIIGSKPAEIIGQIEFEPLGKNGAKLRLFTQGTSAQIKISATLATTPAIISAA